MTTSARKIVRPGEEFTPRVERIGNVWHIRSMSAVRQVLRARESTVQAGFNAEHIPDGKLRRPPILFLDGQRHKEQRSRVARFFAPKTVAKRYRGLMESRADELVTKMVDATYVNLDDISFRYSVDIASAVIGLTNSNPKGMARRLSTFFDAPSLEEFEAMGRVRAVTNQVPMMGNMASFYLHDVLPAIRARRKHPEDDVLTSLIEQGYDDPAILIECITFGAAGMVTTREFITMATWHLLENEPLRQRYLVAEEDERYAILLEILRLEPIVGHLYRRAQNDITITDGDDTFEIRAGELCDLYIRAANADPCAVGDDPETLCPGRDLPRGVGAEVESFGDGAHTCPGNSLAIQETDALLTRLLACDVAIMRRPRIGWDDLIAGYSLRGFRLRVR